MRRWVLAAFALLLAVPASAQLAERPVRIIVPFPPGGSTDLIARVVAEAATPFTPRGFVLENRGGAGGNIGMAEAARAAPDGTTLVACTFGSCGANPALYPNPGFDLLEDFAPIIMTAAVRNVLTARRDLPVSDIASLIALGRRQSLTYGSAGVGASNHLGPALLAGSQGMQWVHAPYRGSAAAITDALGGRVDLVMDNLPSILPHIRSGALRAIGVTSASRAPELPDVPTFTEAGIAGMEVDSWFGFLAPARTPPAVLVALNQAFARALAEPVLVSRLQELGAAPIGGSAAAMGAHMRAEVARWGAVVRANAIRAD
jgi:tripartite-type tricarboxylate transporter receptor subunit TctC